METNNRLNFLRWAGKRRWTTTKNLSPIPTLNARKVLLVLGICLGLVGMLPVGWEQSYPATEDQPGLGRRELSFGLGSFGVLASFWWEWVLSLWSVPGDADRRQTKSFACKQSLAEEQARHRDTEAKLRRLEIRWNTLLETTPDIVVEVDPNFVFTSANRTSPEVLRGGPPRPRKLANSCFIRSPSISNRDVCSKGSRPISIWKTGSGGPMASAG